MSECTVHDVRAAEPVCFMCRRPLLPMAEAVRLRQQERLSAASAYTYPA